MIYLVLIYLGAITVGVLVIGWVLWNYELKIEVREEECKECGNTLVEPKIAEYGLWSSN